MGYSLVIRAQNSLSKLVCFYFVLNIIEMYIQPSNVEVLCSSVVQIAQTLDVLHSEAQEVYTNFHTIFSQFSRCHSLYDSCAMSQWSIVQLGKYKSLMVTQKLVAFVY